MRRSPLAAIVIIRVPSGRAPADPARRKAKTSRTIAFTPTEIAARLVTRSSLTTRGRLAAARHGVERHGGEEDDPGGDELHRVGVADEVDAVRDHPDDQPAEERAADPSAAAEEADAADHRRRDRVEQDRAAAGRRVDRVQPRGEDDPAESGHRARDHEDEDPDELDVDAGPAGGLGVAADRVDVAAKGRPAGDVRAEDDYEEDDQADERNAAGLVAAPDGREGEAAEEGDAKDRQDRVSGRQAGATATQERAEARGREADGEDDRDRPPPILRQHVVRDVVDLLVLDPDHALRAERLQDHALPHEQPG